MNTSQSEMIHVRLLGRVELENRWGAVSDDLSRHTLAGMLLKYLLVEPGGEVSLEELMTGGVWPAGQTDESIIRVRLVRLRKALEPLRLGGRDGLVLYSGGRYSLNPRYALQTDTAELTALMADIRACPVDDPAGVELRRKALELFRGPFMEGTEDAPWVAPYRRYYHRQFAALAENMLERMQVSDDLCQRAVAILPEDERLHGAIITHLMQQRRLREVTRHITQLDRSGRADWIDKRVGA